MPTVNFSGLSSGIDWALLIDAQIQARRARIITPIENWQSSWEVKLSGFEQLRALLVALQDAVNDIDTPQELRAYSATSSSESAVEVTVSANATPGAHSVEVNQLARAEVKVHAGVAAAETVVNNSGASQDFVYLYGSQSVTVEVESATTLEGLVNLINDDPDNPGVAASILDDGSEGFSSHHLVLTGRQTGADYTITIDADNTTLAGDWGDLSADAAAGSSAVTLADVSPLSQYQAIIINDEDSDAEYHIVEYIAGNTLNLRGTLGSDFTVAQNAYATPRGIGSGLAGSASSGTSQVTVGDASHFQVGGTVVIADGSNSEELAISEVDTANNTLTFTTSLANDYAAEGFVTQLEGGREFTFKEADFTQTQSAQNAQIRVDGYPPGSWIERDTNVIGDAIGGVTLDLKNTTTGSVTITVSEDKEAVKQKIRDFVDAYNAVKTFLNEKTSYDQSTGEAGELMGNYGATLVDSLLRDIVTTPAPGFQDGTDPYTLLGQIGIETSALDSTDTAAGTLTIDEAALDEALADDSEGVRRLFAEDFRGYSDSSYLTFHQASDVLTTPGKYDVEVDFDASGNITGARMKLTTESTFRDATVESGYVVGASANPEGGLWVKVEWDGSSSTQTAVVRVTQGVAGAISYALDDMLDSTEGLIHNIASSYEEIVSHMEDRIEQEEKRLDLIRQQLTQRYARLEQLLAQLQGQSQWVAQMAASMSGF